MLVRAERRSDHDAIAAVVTAAFERPNEALLVERIRASINYVPELALVADEGGEVVGHVLFSHVGLRDGRTRTVLQLAPLAVAPAHQGRGIGSALVLAGLELADARGEPLVAVVGHGAYYPRFGFEPARRHGVEPPSPSIPESVFMVRRLGAYHERCRGRLMLPPAFDVT